MPTRTPIRRGKAVTLTLDLDAVPLLRQLAPNARRYGGLVSELLRRELALREERAKVTQELLAGHEQG